MVRVSLLGLVLVRTDSIVQICVHVQILHILFFVCHSPQLHNFKVFLFLIVLNRYIFLHWNSYKCVELQMLLNLVRYLHSALLQLLDSTSTAWN